MCVRFDSNLERRESFKENLKGTEHEKLVTCCHDFDAMNLNLSSIGTLTRPQNMVQTTQN